MDFLWDITDTVFTKAEIDKFSVSEAFVLGASFYFHDLGMAIAATKEGIEELKITEKYKSSYERAINFYKLDNDQAHIIALRITSRELHSTYALKLCSEKILGIEKYIIEKESLRTNWANYIGEISASHHWSISTIEEKLGIRGVIPSPEGDHMDLAFIACALRIIDYAHINSERANYIDRLLRLNIDEESLLHWKAQENINGPSRQDNKLKYASNKPINDVEAWWLFYDMTTGLDREIVSVSEYLSTKTYSSGRFSLDGVLNVKNPKSFSTSVRTSSFEPIDIRFKPDSIERLIEILGGKTLYGNDQFAPLREILQNSRDAILLRQKQEDEHGDSNYCGKVTILIDSSSAPPKLVIKDNGVGMTSNIIENFLLGIASDYWNSPEFYHEFPEAKKKGFSPTGKFGIGFLSVFMIGDNVVVETERKGKSKLKLTLKGLGKHGSLISMNSSGDFGTSIEISIGKQDASIYNNIEAIVRARVPMLTFPVNIKTASKTISIDPYWWKETSQKELFDFALNWEKSAGFIETEREMILDFDFFYNYRKVVEFLSVDRYKKWPDKQPEIISDNYRLLAIPDYGKLIICSKGVAVKSIRFNGLTGIVQIDDLQLTASRDQTIKWQNEDFFKRAILDIKPLIIESLNKLKDEGMITSRFEFVTKVVKIYGEDLLLESTLPWIPIIIPPGDIKLFDVNEVVSLLSKKDEIIINYGADPWTTESICRNYFPSATDSVIIFPVNKINQPSFGHYSDKGIVMDSLPKQFRENEKEDPTDKYKDAIYLYSLLKVISKSWNIDVSKLINADWLRESNDHLCGYFKRKELI